MLRATCATLHSYGTGCELLGLYLGDLLFKMTYLLVADVEDPSSLSMEVFDWSHIAL